MKKSEIPAQAVWNKLYIFLLPAVLANLNFYVTKLLYYNRIKWPGEETAGRKDKH